MGIIQPSLLQQIRDTNDYERKLFGAECRLFNERMRRWHSKLRPYQANNNFYCALAPITKADIREAEKLQKARDLDYLLIRSGEPLPRELVKDMEENVLLVMALTEGTWQAWEENSSVEIRDIQSHDISADILDVSGVPEPYRDLARRNMEMVIEVAQAHPEYHWYCGYLNGVPVANAYALRHGGCVEMDDLWVREDCRNQHIATTLMKHIARTLPGILYLHADDARTPKNMYKKMGFEIVDRVYEYYKEF